MRFVSITELACASGRGRWKLVLQTGYQLAVPARECTLIPPSVSGASIQNNLKRRTALIMQSVSFAQEVRFSLIDFAD